MGLEWELKVVASLGPLFHPIRKGPDYDGREPADIVAKVAEILKEGGATAANETYFGELTPLHLMGKQRPNEFDANPAKRQVGELLIAANADLEAKDQFGQTPLCLASMTEEPDGGLCKVLCAAGARADVPEKNFGNTALHWAAMGGLPLVMEPMLQTAGAVEAMAMKNLEGKTPKEIAQARANPKTGYPYKSCSQLVKMLTAAEKEAALAAKKAAKAA
jgi:hypothetical protein